MGAKLHEDMIGNGLIPAPPRRREVRSVIECDTLV
jgi:hypothetical protein